MHEHDAVVKYKVFLFNLNPEKNKKKNKKMQ